MNGPLGYLVRHWRGALPLWVAFWVNGALVAVLAQLALWLAKPPLEHALATASLAVLKAALIGAMASGILLLTWLFVGIWRAAAAQLAQGRISGWERSAQLTVLIGVFVAINNYVDLLFATMPLLSR